MKIFSKLKNQILKGKDMIAVASLSASEYQYNKSIARQVTPSSIKEFEEYVLINNEIYIRTIIAGVPETSDLGGYPENLNPHLIDDLLEIVADGYSISYSYTIIPIHNIAAMKMLDQAAYSNRVSMQSFLDTPKPGKIMDSTKQPPYVKILEAQTFNKNTEALYNNAEKMNHTALIITLKANTREALRNAESHVRVALESNRVYYEFPETRHLETYLAAQPYPFWYERSWCELFSYHTALLMPTRNPNSRTSDEGLLFGEDLKTGKPIQINLKALAAQHLFWSGSTGTGKTYSMFLLLMRAFSMLKKRIIFITPKDDPGTSHRNVAEYFGKAATIIDLGPSTSTQKRHTINPMEIFYEKGLKNDEAEGRYYSHLNILLKFFDVLLLSDVTSKSNMISYLIRTIVQAYENKGIKKNNLATWKNWPVLLDLYKIWERESESNPTAKALLNKSEMIKYQWNYLNQQSDIDLSADFIVIDTSGIDSSSDRLQDAFNVLVTSIMGMRFKSDYEKETIIAVDEAAVFLRDKLLSLFLLRTLTQGRSQGISLWLATQQTGDLAKADLEEEFKTNISVNIIMGGMRGDNIDHVAKFFKFDEYTRNLLLGCGRGEGLIILNDQVIPVVFKATELEHSIIKGTVKGKKETSDFLFEFVDPALSDLVTEHGICFNSWVKGDSSVLVDKGFRSQRVIDAIDGKSCQVWIKQKPDNMTLDHFAMVMRLAGHLITSKAAIVQINHSADADIVADINGMKVAFEYERPGSHTTQQLIEKQERAQAKYDKVVFVCQAQNLEQLIKAVGVQNVVTRGMELAEYIAEMQCLKGEKVVN